VKTAVAPKKTEMVDTPRFALSQTTGSCVVVSNAHQWFNEEGRPDQLVTRLMDGGPLNAAMEAARHAMFERCPVAQQHVNAALERWMKRSALPPWAAGHMTHL